MFPSTRNNSPGECESSKRPHTEVEAIHRKIATAEAAARVDANPPLSQLLMASKEVMQQKSSGGESVIYWMRLEDMRSSYFFSPLIYSISLIKYSSSR